MNKIFPALIATICLYVTGLAQTDSSITYKKTSVMIPMRDGTKLYTVVLSPATVQEPLPLLLQRTPYGASLPIKDDSLFDIAPSSGLYLLAKSGYIFVTQDIRGKYRSEGTMQIHQPLTHAAKPGSTDESTDTWDTVDWLAKHIPHNNGRAGIYGISYPGWLALVGSVDPHPALKAASEQACMGDLFLGDDFHHNGAFRLSYGMEYTYEVEFDHSTDSDFPFPQYDLYDWYLQLGSLKHVNEKYFHHKIPTWNSFVEHPNYDAYWQSNSPLSYVHYPQIPQLHVGGYFDQEDINGPQLMYGQMEKKDTFNRNHIVLGPWNHGQWGRGRGDSLGKISFGSNTGEWFRRLQLQWFDYWLKNAGDGRFAEAYCFQTGSNQWKTYASWPPKNAIIQNLYAGQGNKASFSRPTATRGYLSYFSDPARPVPYRTQPIEATYGPGSRWRSWQVEDQRFAYSRPDVVSFSTDTLTEAITVTGQIKAHLFASTSGTDADWIVKLIDVYPDADQSNLAMSSFQLPVAMEVFRGRYRKSFIHAEPLTPGKPEEFVIDLHQINHRFLRGHRLMIQVQSTWFPVIDRNPQKYVPDIFRANDNDFTRSEQRVYFTAQYPTHIELPVMKE